MRRRMVWPSARSTMVTPMSIVLFEDPLVAQLDPTALGRPAFAITCGSYRLIDLVARLNGGCRCGTCVAI